jgi:hypothetical protein
MRLRKAENFGSGQASIPGRLVLDGIDLLRGAFVKMDEYSLDSVAREYPRQSRAGRRTRSHRRILHNYRNDLRLRCMHARMHDSPTKSCAS